MNPRVDINLGIEGEPDRWVQSACVLCSNGCGLEIAVKDERIVGVRGNPKHPVNFGHLGPKGENGWVANNDPRRGTQPMIRREKGGQMEPVSWSEAMDFHTRTKTGRSEALNRRAPRPYVEIHPEDAERLGIRLGDIVEVTSPNGVWTGPAMVVDLTRPGELFIPFHYGHGRAAANQHTWYARDPVSQQPQFKSAPVNLRRKSFGLPEQWMLDRRAELAGESNEPYAARSIGGTRMEAVG